VKIYTRTGDRGETSLFDGSRVVKSDARVAAYGEVDELGAWIGLVRASGVNGELGAMLERVQRDLFAIGARLADPGHKIAQRVTRAAIQDEDISRLEAWIDLLEGQLPPLRRFILAGGSLSGAMLHVARTICRRAEIAALAIPDRLNPLATVYLNRLSDLLFVLARAANAGRPEPLWKPGASR
jgi:cob(I)alamin adenosyltransferase